MGSEISGNDVKHKGLYSNIRRAYCKASDGNSDLLFTFQADTQVIRKFNYQELASLYSFFNQHDTTYQIACTFKKKH